MEKYIIMDIAAVLCYLPYGMAAGMLVAFLLKAVNDKRVKKEKVPMSVWGYSGFVMYAVIILCITFLSRESGSRKGVDLELLSTWGINDRNNAYMIENVLLFIPYGFSCSCVFKKARNVIVCTAIGALTSLGIEWLQLMTERGFFQIDDMLTNTIGAFIGGVIFLWINKLRLWWRKQIR